MDSFLRINFSVSGSGTFYGSALRRDSASSICDSIDLLSQHRAISSLYAHAAPIESAHPVALSHGPGHALHLGHQSQRIFTVDLAGFGRETRPRTMAALSKTLSVTETNSPA